MNKANINNVDQHTRDNNNNNTNELNVNTVNNLISNNSHTNNSILLNANNVLVPAILSNCLSYLQLKELNLIINRVNKYWANHTYNNITLGYRKVELKDKEYRLLFRYTTDINNDSNNNNQAVNLLLQLKYTSNITLGLITSAELFIYIINKAEHTHSLTIHVGDGFDCLEITDQSWSNIRLDKLDSLHISCHYKRLDGAMCHHLLTKLMKYCIDSDKITSICLNGRIPLHSKPLQVFENNPFNNLTSLTLQVEAREKDDSLKYLSNLMHLTRFYLHIFNAFWVSLENWDWLIALINVEEVRLFTLAKLQPSHQANCVKTLTTLPKLILLTISVHLLNDCDEFIQLFSQSRHLTSLYIHDDLSFNQHDLNLTTFPKIPSLTDVTVGGKDPTYIIPILKSNPQIHTIKFEESYPPQDFAIDVLKVAPSLLQYSMFCNSNIISCCERYPHTLVTATSSNYKAFINSNAREQLITRIKQHLQDSYSCPHCLEFSNSLLLRKL